MFLKSEDYGVYLGKNKIYFAVELMMCAMLFMVKDIARCKDI